MDKKVVMAMVNGALCIDPSDIDKVDLKATSAMLKEKYGHEIPIKVAPISTWMPDCGTEAVMDLAAKEMHEKAIRNIEASKNYNYMIPNGNNRRKRRAMARAEKKRKK